jgi:hypothetical protein
VAAAQEDPLWNGHYLAFASFEAAIEGFFRNLGSCCEQLVSLITDHFRCSGHRRSNFLRPGGNAASGTPG